MRDTQCDQPEVYFEKSKKDKGIFQTLQHCKTIRINRGGCTQGSHHRHTLNIFGTEKCLRSNIKKKSDTKLAKNYIKTTCTQEYHQSDKMLDPYMYQTRRFVGSYLGPNCLQRLAVVHKSGQIIET